MTKSIDRQFSRVYYSSNRHKNMSVSRTDRKEKTMNKEKEPLFIGVDTVMFDLGVSRAKAYDVIKELNAQMKKENPRAIVVSGKVNRIWYEEACLRGGGNNGSL